MVKIASVRTPIHAFIVVIALCSQILAAPDLQVGVWTKITPSTWPAGARCFDLQFAASNRSILYSVLFDEAQEGGIYKSTDAGSTWARVDNLPRPLSAGRIRVDPNDPNHLYFCGSVLGATLGFRVSHDGGATWTIPAAFSAGLGTRWISDVYNMEVDPTDFNHVIMNFHNAWPGFGGAGILETKDGGATFIPHDPVDGMSYAGGLTFLYNPAKGIGNADTWLLGNGYGQGLYRTTDAGATWTNVQPDFQDNHGGFDAHYSTQSGYIYVGGNSKVIRSTDNGATWTKAMGDLGAWYYGVIEDGNKLYVAAAMIGQSPSAWQVAEEGGTNEGLSWTVSTMTRLPDAIWRTVFDSVNKILYVANWTGGGWAMKTEASVAVVSEQGTAKVALKAGAGVSRSRVLRGQVVIERAVQKNQTRLFNVKGMLVK